MRAFLFSALALVLNGGCSNAEDGEPSASGGSAGQAGTAGQGAEGALPSSLAFEPVASLAARQRVTLSVQASPAGRYRVRFALLSSQGDPLDAVLDRSEAETDDMGRTSVGLTASSASTTFAVRASVSATVVATQLIEVTDSGSATLQVQPVYLGHRPIGTWVATVHENKTCADLPGVPPADGAQQALASSQQAPELTGVRVGRPLAVTLRSGHFVGGCASIEMLPAGPANGRHSVQVTVLDRPIDLSASHLSFSLGLAEPETTWSALTSAAAADVRVALLGTSTDDVDALLDAMRSSLTGSARQKLDAARQSEAWDNLLGAHWGASAGSKLRDTVGSWLSAGNAGLIAGDHVFGGQLTPVDQKTAQLSLLLVAGLTAEQAGFISPALASWHANADDTVLLATDLYLSSSRLTTGLAEPVALAAFDQAASAAEALSLALGCTELASELTATGTDPLLAYDACDASCLSELCDQAMATLWSRGREATSSAPARLGITAAGAARVGDQAQVAGISGSWVGELSTQGGVEKTTGGALSAAEPPIVPK